jgi:FkbM family methyltransferase
MLDFLKKKVEKGLNCRIYRHSLPRGADLSFDLHREFGRESFRTVFDVGAHRGEIARHFAGIFPSATIYAFEPVAALFGQLQRSTANEARIRPFPLAMGREPGAASIHLGEGPATNSSILHQVSDTGRTETIQIESLSNFAEKENIGTIDFLKIDTEGYELEVLAGAEPLLRQQRIRMIYAECAPVKTAQVFVSLAQLAEFLQPHGYELFGIYDQQPHWEGRRTLLYFNALFLCPDLAPPGSRLTEARR